MKIALKIASCTRIGTRVGVRIGTLAAISLLACATGNGTTQSAGPPPAPGALQNPIPMRNTHGDVDQPLSPGQQEKQEKARNQDRQKRLVSDTDKLLSLATQLRDDVARTDKNILSVDVVRRAEEIEKLARSVKERMKS